jgi:2-phosphosulfolactate phosphatase
VSKLFSEWGLAGMATLREEAAVLVIVDVLSFSTAVEVAVSAGASVIPFAYGDEAAAKAKADRLGAQLARSRRAAGGQLSLSPKSLQRLSPGTKLLLPSPNGSRLSLAGGGTPVLTGCLRNAAAVAGMAARIAAGGSIAVVPAGERWQDGSLRPAIEDLLGAGAFLHHLDLPPSPEAQVARDAYRTAAGAGELAALIRASVSGLELSSRGFADDVEMAVQENVSRVVPRLIEGAYRAV